MIRNFIILLSILMSFKAYAIKISDLTESTNAASDDLAVIVDSSSNETKKITYANLTRTVNVDDYGAAGDGATNDNDEIDAAITACGTNCVLRFTPGKTYLIDRNVLPLANQTWWGYGATIKKVDRVASTFTTASVPNGTTVFDVADSTDFRVGMHVAGWENGDETAHMTVPSTITGIDGNEITVAPGLAYASGFSSGDNIESAMEMIVSAADDVKILGFTIDGNGASYTAFQAWELHSDIVLSGARSLVQDVYFLNPQLEGLSISGDASAAINNYFESAGGNAAHLSASDGLRIEGNYIFDSQVRNSEDTNHQDGAISISNAVVNATISDNYYDGNDNGWAFVGGFAIDTQNMTIIGNHVRDTTQACVEAQTNFSSDSVGHSVMANNFDNCVAFTFNDTGGNLGLKKIAISNNVINDSKFLIDNVDGFTISGNAVDLSGLASGTAFQILDSENGVISGNSIVSGGSVLPVSLDSSGSSPPLLRNIAFDGNVLTNHTQNTNLMSILASGAEAENIAVRNNVMVGGTNANNVSAILIRADDVLVQGNYIDWRGVTGGSNYAINWDGNHASGGSLIGNYILHLVTEGSVQVFSDVPDLQVIGNTLIGLSAWNSVGGYIGGNYFEDDVFLQADDITFVNNFVKDGTVDLSATTDTCFVNGNRIDGTGDDITINSGATGNVVTNNAATGGITDSGTSTVTTSQNHTL